MKPPPTPTMHWIHPITTGEPVCNTYHSVVVTSNLKLVTCRTCRRTKVFKDHLRAVNIR